MDVTPGTKMFEAMSAFVDATVGENPGPHETTAAAEKRRDARRKVFDFLHGLVRLSMREGIRRDRAARGMPVAADEVQPNPLKRDAANSSLIMTE
jgi:hypothetical protein